MDQAIPRPQDPETAALLARLLANPRGMRELATALRQVALSLELIANAPYTYPQRPRPDWYQP